MIFWTLAALVVVITIVTAYMDDFMPFASGFLAFLLSTVAGAVIWLLCVWLIPSNVDLISERTYQLRALGNNSAIQGRSYFLGGGYIGEKRVLNYISQRDGGAIKVERADAEDSTIYEDADKATVTVRHYDHNNWWVATWPIGDSYAYEFHIPKDSVLESYAIDNKE